MVHTFFILFKVGEKVPHSKISKMGLKWDQSPTRLCARPIYHFTESAETAPNFDLLWQMMPKDKEDGKRRWAPHDYGSNLVVAPLSACYQGI